MDPIKNTFKISIVTPSFNQGQFIEETIISVLDQNYPNLEYIIIDGGSTDNTVEIIKKYEKYLKYWVSEKDKGQAHAINKGLKHCTGEIFNWLNSDDYLERGALGKIENAFKEGVQMVAGKVRIFDTNETIQYVQHKNLSARGLISWLPGTQFVQPGVWMRKELIQKCGGIDERLHYSFDWDLYIRYLSKFPAIKYIDDLLINFRYHDQSKTISSPDQFHKEELKIIQKFAHQKENQNLQRMAANALSGRVLRPAIKDIVNDSDKNRFRKIMMIARKVDKKNWLHWRTIFGAIKKVLEGKKIA